jgi:hypothetical protein
MFGHRGSRRAVLGDKPFEALGINPKEDHRLMIQYNALFPLDYNYLINLHRTHNKKR